MIGSIKGILVEAGPLSALVEVTGIGYDVAIPVTTAEKLPKIGETVRLYTFPIYRETEQSLYGFTTREEREFFRLLVDKVSGIGPKIALSIMSKFSLPLLQSAIASGDVALLSKCPGIGKKTAERVIVELRDKVVPGMIYPHAARGAKQVAGAPASPETARLAPSRLQDAVQALMMLGFKAADADKAVRRAAGEKGPDTTTEELIRDALR